jgi:hypothetical protein
VPSKRPEVRRHSQRRNGRHFNTGDLPGATVRPERPASRYSSRRKGRRRGGPQTSHKDQGRKARRLNGLVK